MLALALSLLIGEDLSSQFVKAYSQRRGDDAVARPDPAIERAMDLMIEAERKSPNSDVADLFAKAIHKPRSSEYDLTQYGLIDVNSELVGGMTFVTAVMGAVTRSRAFRADGTQVRLPAEFSWNCPMNPEFHSLPSGQIMAYEWQILQAGFHERVRAVWLRVQGRRAKIVGSFGGDTTLDDAEPAIQGNTVQITTIDRPKALVVSDAESLFERKTMFDCSGTRPRKLRVVLAQPELRAVDNAVSAAWYAKHPTVLQERLRRWWSAGADFENWKVRDNGVDVEDLHFGLGHRKSGLPVVTGVSKLKT